MPTLQPNPSKSNWEYVFTHNPFYVISAVFTLYGLHLSFGNNIDPTQGWLQLQIFVGYILLLASTGVLVVRWGEVWEDARTLFLLVLLLLVALSVSFDRVCLDNEILGLQFLTICFVFSILLCECLLRYLGIYLPWIYRGVLYLQFALLFFYPPWLGHLSLIDRLDTLAWYTMGFPTIVAVTVLMLLPAARKRSCGLENNGTPWRWPWYPWTIFVVLGIGITIRILTITFSFDPTKGGFTTGFQAYFLIPLVLSIILITAENCIGRRNHKPWIRFIVLPLFLFGWSLPGSPDTVAQARYLSVLQDSIGSPIQITAVLLIAYFVYLLFKRLQSAEWGILISLGVLSITDHNTLDLHTLAPPKATTATVAFILLLGSALARQSTLRLCIFISSCVLASTYSLWDTNFANDQGYFPLHLTMILLATAGFIFDDQLGRFLRRYTSTVLLLIAIFSLLAYRFIFPAIAPPWHALSTLCFAVIIAIYWRRERLFKQLIYLITCLLIPVGHLADYYVNNILDLFVLQGKKWIAWGALSFIAGLMVSFLKGGQIRKFYRRIQEWNRISPQPPSESQKTPS